MRCGRSDRVELDAFLLGEAGVEGVDAFREHYPHCEECAEVVADWMALDDALREVAAEAGESASAHPEPEELAGYVEAPERLGEKAMRIETHVSGCARCANELRLIQAFDPAVFGGASEAMPAIARDRAPAQAGILESLREALAGFLERLRGFDLMSPAPALALAMLLLAGLWASGALDGLRGEGERSGPQLVERRAPEAVPPVPAATPDSSSTPAQAPEPEAELPGMAPARPEQSDERAPSAEAPMIAQIEASPREPASEPAAAPTTELAAAPEALPPREPAPRKPTPAPVPEPPAAAPREEIQLASLTDLPPPDYATPDGAESLVWMRQFGAVRAAPGAVRVRARAPGDHTGITLSRSPRLWWALDQATDLPVQITIVDGDAIDPVVRVELKGPHAAGLHAFDLSSHGAELAPDVDYRWFVTILVDPDRPSRNPVSAGSLRVAGSADARRATVSSADASVRGNKFAELGLWYDAFDFYASLAEAHPEVERLATYRDRLAEVAQPAP